MQMGFWGKKTAWWPILPSFNPGYFLFKKLRSVEKVKSKWMIVDDYEIFEVVRPNCPVGGSILTGVHKSLNPVFIKV